MGHRVSPVCVVVLVAALLAAPAAWADSGDRADAELGTYLVVLDSGDPEEIAAEHAGGHDAEIDHVYTAAVQGYAARMSERDAERIASDDRVAAVEPDRRVTVAQDNSGDSVQPAQDDSGDSVEPAQDDRVPTGLHRIFWPESSAYADGNGASVDVGVAILDTGIDPDHPDLNVVGGHNCAPGPADAWQDGNGHGTHVAGTVGARGGILGVAPETPLYSVRVLDDYGFGTLSSLVCGIDWVTAHAGAVTVANMSLGGSGGAGEDCDASPLRAAICASVDAGVTYVAAAGNSGADVSGFVPAAFPEVITVGALADFDGEPGGQAPPTCRDDVDDTWAAFSNHSAVDGGVDLAAPGTCIESTWRGGGYLTVSGTSVAAPHDYSHTWDGTAPVPGPRPPLLDVADF